MIPRTSLGLFVNTLIVLFRPSADKRKKYTTSVRKLRQVSRQA